VQSSAFGPLNVNALIFMLEWAWCGFHKRHIGTRYTKVLFLRLVGSAGHVMHSGALRARKSTHYFSCSGGPGAVSIKKRSGTCYVELLCLHSIGFAGHIVHFGASKTSNINALFFMLEWAQCGIHKKHAGTHYAKHVFLHRWVLRVMWHILVHPGVKC
jgi:hypothetical protein